MLTLDHLHKRFGSVTAVDDLSLAIEPGEVFGLLGPNGAGKSTTVHISVGLTCPDAGRVLLSDGGCPTEAATRAKIGFAPQSLALYEDLGAEVNLQFFARLNGLDRRTARQRVGWSLDFAGLTGRRADPVRTFSGGMKRRLNLAVALVHNPPLLVLDEPTVGVDPQSRNAILDSVSNLAREGVTVIYTTHYMEEAQRVCNRVGIIDHGRLLAIDSVDGLIREYGGRETVVVERDGREERIESDDPVGELIRRRNQDAATRLRLERPNLESVFLHLTGRSLRD